MQILKTVLLVALSRAVTIGVSVGVVGVTVWAMKKKVVSATRNVMNACVEEAAAALAGR